MKEDVLEELLIEEEDKNPQEYLIQHDSMAIQKLKQTKIEELDSTVKKERTFLNKKNN